MRIKQTLFILALSMGMSGLFMSPLVSAVSCGGVDTSIIDCDQSGEGSGKCPDGKIISKDDIKSGVLCSDGSKPDITINTGVWGLLIVAINILTAGIGISAVGGITYGAIIYATAKDSASKTTEAKTLIFNIVAGLIAYMLMFSFLNFIIPGGVFN